VYLGPRNSEAVMGLPWRRVRDHARELGVPVVRVGKALLVPLDALVDALRGRTQASPSAPDAAEALPLDPAEIIRQRLGVRRVS
jgi:hypothetical protein